MWRVSCQEKQRPFPSPVVLQLIPLLNVGTQLVSKLRRCGVVEKTRRCRFKIDPELLRKQGEDRKSGFGEGKQGKRINSRKHKIQYIFKLHGKLLADEPGDRCNIPAG